MSTGNTKFGISYILYAINAKPFSYLYFIFCSRSPENKIVIILSKGTLAILGINRIIIGVINHVKTRFELGISIDWIIIDIVVIFVSYYLLNIILRYFPNGLWNNK